MTQVHSCDLAIVGGGIMGAWALHLASVRFPTWRIILLEAAKIAGGATAHSAGVFLPMGRSDRERRLAGRSATHYATARRLFALETSDAPAYWIASQEMLPALQEAGVGFTLTAWGHHLDQAPKGLKINGHNKLFHGGVATSFEPAAVATALIRRSARPSSASVWEGVGVQKIKAQQSAIDLVLSDGEVLSAERVIAATGPWMQNGPFSEQAFAENIRIKKVVALHIDEAPQPGAPTIFIPAADAYLMPIPRRDQWLFSFRSEEWDVLPERSSLTISRADTALAHATLNEFFPSLADRCHGGRVFCDAYSPNQEPIVIRQYDGRLILLGAGSGAGFRLAPGLAEEAILSLA